MSDTADVIPEDDSEEVVIEHPPADPTPPPHVHHNRLVVCKKTAESVTIGPLMKAPSDQSTGHEGKYTYTRTTETDSKGRAIFRQESA